MTLSASYLAYSAEYEVLDRALESPRGMRVPAHSYDAAQHYRHRLHKARAVDRKRNTEIYAPGDPGYGISPYDPLMVRIRPEGEQFYVYIEQTRPPTGIEEIPEAGVPEMQRRIEAPPLRSLPQLEFKRRF